MRVPGYCTVCHRPRTVRVSSQGMVMLAVSHVAQGICQECEDAAEEKRKRRVRC